MESINEIKTDALSNDKEDKMWDEYKQHQIGVFSKSQDDFEKMLTLISSGGLVIALTFLDKIFQYGLPINYKLLFILTIVGFAGCLILNLISHSVAIENTVQNIDEASRKDHNIFKNSSLRNKKISLLNNLSIVGLSIGIIFIFSFFTLNFLNMSKQINDQQQKPKTNLPKPGTLNEQKGRTSIEPTSFIKPKKPTQNDKS